MLLSEPTEITFIYLYATLRNVAYLASDRKKGLEGDNDSGQRGDHNRISSKTG